MRRIESAAKCSSPLKQPRISRNVLIENEMVALAELGEKINQAGIRRRGISVPEP